ncbi:MAG TPA: glycosyltransferase family 2 protein [Candidatus Krumholzibacteria bacterium]|nr:glycosyltransferase family 2 protein [Candidatus Krumholzibacteria bacterium]
MAALALTFWFSVAMLAYIYAGYPLLIRLVGNLQARRVRRGEPGVYTPGVTVMIAAYNEAAHIEATVRNKLASDYPADRLEVVVISDGSDDGTDAIVQGIGDPRVRLIRQEPRAGKTSALNLAMPSVSSEVIVFSDANSIYRPDTIAQLVAPLADPEVGYVTGRMVYKAPDGSATGEGCSTYMKYENKLREWETLAGSIVGVDGGVDALRRELWQPMNPDQLPDFVEPLGIRARGYRVVYEPSALLYEDALAESADEFRMRVRVALRAFHGLKDMARLLDPLRYGLYAWQLWSHKVLRYLAFVFMAGALVSNWALARPSTSGAPWSLLMLGQLLFYAMAMYGRTMAGHRQSLPRTVALAYYFCVVNFASAAAFLQFLQGKKQVTWNPRT